MGALFHLLLSLPFDTLLTYNICGTCLLWRVNMQDPLVSLVTSLLH